jgi:hypothetical protein
MSGGPLDTAIADVIALRTARTVEQAAAEWTSAGRSEHYLWDEKRLTTTLATLDMIGDDASPNPAVSPTVELDNEARAFLNATTRRVTAAKQRERRRRNGTIATLSILLLLVTGTSVFAFRQRSTAQTQRDTAIFNQITTQADRLRSTDISLAAQLDLTAYHMRPKTPDLYTALLTDANATLSTPLNGHKESIKAVAFSRCLRSSGRESNTRKTGLGELPASPKRSPSPSMTGSPPTVALVGTYPRPECHTQPRQLTGTAP